MEKFIFTMILLCIMLTGCGSCHKSGDVYVQEQEQEQEQEDNLDTDSSTIFYTKERNENMEYEFDSMMGFDKLGLYYEAHMAGMNGECFCYSVYFEEGLTDEKFEETDKAICEFIKPYNDKDIYLGYLDVSKVDDKVDIYLDLGNVDPEYSETAINGILKALNNVSGIKCVIVNEGCDFDY